MVESPHILRHRKLPGIFLCLLGQTYHLLSLDQIRFNIRLSQSGSNLFLLPPSHVLSAMEQHFSSSRLFVVPQTCHTLSHICICFFFFLFCPHPLFWLKNSDLFFKMQIKFYFSVKSFPTTPRTSRSFLPL